MSKKLSELTDVEWPVKRRTFLAALGTGAAGGAAALGDGSKQLASIGGVDTGDITSEYRADEEWYGPDSTKGNVSPNTGRKFVALDTGIEYFGDGSVWVDREAYSAKVISTEELSVESEPTINIYDDGGTYRAIGRPDEGEIASGTDILELLSAVDATLNTGRHIHLAAGLYNTRNTYSDGEEWTVTTNGLTLSGDGAASHIRLEDNAVADGEGSKMILVNADEVTFRDFKIDGNQQNNNGETGGADENTIADTSDGHNIRTQGDDFTMRGVYSINSTGDGIEPTSITNRATITNCVFRSNWEQNVHFDGCRRVTVTNCVLENEVNNGMVSTFAGDGQVTEDCVLSNNIIKGGQVDSVKITPGSGAVRNFVCEGNVIEGASMSGILVQEIGTADATPSNIRISNNIIDGVGQDGIRLDGGENIAIHGNTITNIGNKGINFINANGYDYTDVSVHDNDIIDVGMSSASNGITLNPNNNTLTRVTIKDNNIVSKDAGSSMDTAIRTFVGGTGGFVDSEIVGNKLVGYTGDAFGSAPSGLIIRRNTGDFVNGATGHVYRSGDGTTTSFSINHGVDSRVANSNETPRYAIGTTADAQIPIVSATLNGSQITIEFETAPPSGSGNVGIHWEVGYPA